MVKKYFKLFQEIKSSILKALGKIKPLGQRSWPFNNIITFFKKPLTGDKKYDK